MLHPLHASQYTGQIEVSSERKLKPNNIMSSLMFWNKNNSTNDVDNKNSKRNWLHSPETLLNGHVVYPVKFLGNISVEQPKGVDVVKDAIRRIQFAQQLKKSEAGSNSQIKKVEITISVDGVTIQESRPQKMLYQFPLHNISYCADEEGLKKFFSFIAKSPNKSNTLKESEDSHECFVFISSKLASDITLTIGQAFDLAYRRYMSENAKATEISKSQSHIKHLEGIISNYKLRLRELSELVPKADLEKLLARYGVGDICETAQERTVPDLPTKEDANNPNTMFQTKLKSNGLKADDLLLNSDSDSDFDPRADEICGKSIEELVECEPAMPFGQQLFGQQFDPIPTPTPRNNEKQNQIIHPLLAPPPKAGTPRRGVPMTNNTTESHDLFGSIPFHANNSQM